jgi:hypothetical protein
LTLQVSTPHLFYRATEPNPFDTAAPIALRDESNESQSDLQFHDNLDDNSRILGNDCASKKRPLSGDGGPPKRNCQRKGGLTSATLKRRLCNCKDSSI